MGTEAATYSRLIKNFEFPKFYLANLWGAAQRLGCPYTRYAAVEQDGVIRFIHLSIQLSQSVTGYVDFNPWVIAYRGHGAAWHPTGRRNLTVYVLKKRWFAERNIPFLVLGRGMNQSEMWSIMLDWRTKALRGVQTQRIYDTPRIPGTEHEKDRFFYSNLYRGVVMRGELDDLDAYDYEKQKRKRKREAKKEVKSTL